MFSNKRYGFVCKKSDDRPTEIRVVTLEENIPSEDEKPMI